MHGSGKSTDADHWYRLYPLWQGYLNLTLTCCQRHMR